MSDLNPLPYYKWLVKDYRASRRVQRMRWQSRGILRELLDEEWLEGSLPIDASALAEIVGCSQEDIENFWPEIAGCFEESDSRLRNRKLESLRTAMDKTRVARLEAGRAGGLAKAKANQLLAKANQLLSFCHIEEEEEEEEEEERKNLDLSLHEEREGTPLPPEEVVPDVSAQVDAIVCAHPKSVLRSLSPRDVRPLQQEAVIAAMAAEVQSADCSEAEALAMILGRVTLLAEKVPRSEWRFFKDVSEFFRNRDYRLEPEDFAGKTREASVASPYLAPTPCDGITGRYTPHVEIKGMLKGMIERGELQ